MCKLIKFQAILHNSHLIGTNEKPLLKRQACKVSQCNQGRLFKLAAFCLVTMSCLKKSKPLPDCSINKYVDPLYCRADIYACLVSHTEYADWQTDRRIGGRTADCYITLFAIRDAASLITRWSISCLAIPGCASTAH